MEQTWILKLAACLSVGTLLSGCASAPVGDIHRVDFGNFTYVTAAAGKVTAHNGVCRWNTGANPIEFEVAEITYGDLNGDGLDEAAIVTCCNTGGSGVFTEGFVYALKAGQASLLATVEGGDRAFGGINHIAIQDGQLQVERIGTDSCAICPERIETSSYHLNNHLLVQVGEMTKRKYNVHDKQVSCIWPSKEQ